MPAIRWRPKYWYLHSLAHLRYWAGGDPPLTLADIDASTGKGESLELAGGSYFANDEEFAAYLRSFRNGDSPE